MIPWKNNQKAYNHDWYLRHKALVLRRKADWRKRNREKSNASDRRWRLLHPERNEKYQNPEKVLLRAAQFRAKLRGVPFNLELGDIQIPEFCPVLGIKLESQNCRAAPNSPSVDRIIPRLGYVKGNVVVISWRANSLKRDATVEEIVRMGEFYAKFCPRAT